MINVISGLLNLIDIDNNLLMLRKLQLSILNRLSAAPNYPAEQQQLSTSGHYLLFPTSLPISPYYFYSTKINKQLYEYLQKHKIRYVAAFPVRPGVHPQSFWPSTD